ncbi:tRNA (adenine(22)-N(1))-methyltransferase [Paenibacillus marinisediminis]
MIIKLSRRLQQIADLVPNGCRMADIGSDHALLPAYLAKSGLITYAVAGEVNRGPYEAAERQVQTYALEKMVHVRLGDGLAVIEQGEVDCITIAGMGGSLMVSILNAAPEKLAGVTRLVLQPNVGEDLVRRWLREHDWLLVHETILEEDGKIYEVLVADRTEAAAATEAYAAIYKPRQLDCGIMLDEQWLLLMGPFLTQEPSEVFLRKWKGELQKQEKIIMTMAKAEADEVEVRRRHFEKHKATLEGILRCWQKEQR